MKPAIIGALTASILLTASASAAVREDHLSSDSDAAVAMLVGTGGFGARDENAPDEIQQFGRLVGVWRVEQEIRMRDGSWRKEPAGVWVWKYAVGGFGVQDLWYQNAERLPSYIGNLGHDYLLTALRVYDPASKSWKVAWISNSGGGEGGAVFGEFEAKEESGEIVMRGPANEKVGPQRIVFHNFTDNGFNWKSEYSRDGGKTWLEVMRLTAHRIR